MTAPAPWTGFGQGLTTFYFGKAGSLDAFRVPDASWTASLIRGEVAHGLIGGGAATTRHAKTRRAYQINFTGMSPDQANTLLSYYGGGRGNGPWRLVDPSYRNHMATNVSAMGAPVSAISAWSASVSSATPYYDGLFAPAINGSGVLHWPAPPNASTLFEGPSSRFPSATDSAPYIPAFAYVASVYMRTVASTEVVSLAMAATTAAGVTTTTAGVTCNLTTAWQRFTVVVPANTWTNAQAAYANMQITDTSGSSDVLLSNAQTEIVQAGTTQPKAWVFGFGVPNVTINAGLGQNVDFIPFRNTVLNLAEI